MTCLFRELTVKANCFCSTMNPRGSFIFFFMYMPTLSKSYELCEFSCAVSIRGIPSGRRRANLVRPGIQSEHRIHLIFPARAVSYMIKWLIISNPISRSQVSTCCFFPCKSQMELLSYSIQHMMVSWWSNETLFFFSFSPPTGSSVPEPKYRENIYTTVDLKFSFHFLSSSLLPAVRGEN